MKDARATKTAIADACSKAIGLQERSKEVHREEFRITAGGRTLVWSSING
jgi:hypothetical protein